MRELLIGSRHVGTEHSPFLIAEAGINHNGILSVALEMCDVAKQAGADAVKFQTFKASEFCGDPAQSFTYISQGEKVTEPMLSMFGRYEFSVSDWRAIRAHCDEIDITFFSTPQNRSDLEVLLDVGVPVLKIGSDDLTNTPLVRAFAGSGLPLILSCGMGDLADVHNALDAACWFEGGQVALMLCTSQYPTPPQDVHVAKLGALRGAFPGLLLGFSDHSQGTTAATLAVALGARIFEKHFTLDHALPGPDHWFSEDPPGLAEWIAAIHRADTMLGEPFVRPTIAERDMRILARRSVVALRDIASGEPLTATNIGVRRPGGGLPPIMIEQIWGLRAARRIRMGERLSLGDMRT